MKTADGGDQWGLSGVDWFELHANCPVGSLPSHGPYYKARGPANEGEVYRED